MIHSYAQALEDVLLFRALKNVQDGFYIDVGAYHPTTDSVTKLFYDKGWHGINIEASPLLFPAFQVDRPRDINLNLAASDRTGEVEFHQIGTTGLSTMIAETADRASERGFEPQSFKVACEKLETICLRHAAQTIHFLKIDVEGAEAAVLRGADFSKFRPWIVLVEATEPLTNVQNHHDWEFTLTENGYEFAVFDGLNRFYVAREHMQLKELLSFPADDYERATSVWTRGHLEQQVRELETRLRSGSDLSIPNPAAMLGYHGDSENRVYRAFVGGTQPLTSPPAQVPFTSTLCQQLHYSLDQYRFWCRAFKDQPKYLRKQWEFVYIAQALYERGFLASGKRGLAFGVGREPLPALFASFGAEIVATDQSLEEAVRAGWANSSEHSIDLSKLNDRHICTSNMFDKLVKFMELDMNAIPSMLDNTFDFCWSACALEHLGSLQAGLDFIVNSINVLKPGGIAIHTTEFNLSSNDQTIDHPNLSLYRRRDVEGLIERMQTLGHRVEPIDWTVGEGAAEVVVDLPPFGRGEPHLRVELHGFNCTSIGLIVVKGNPSKLMRAE